ncbi:MAG TPA: hypothetical protein DIT84_08555 [Clostridiales bacterium]|nr:hypothetical protein [Clostridiales bacterium]
MNGKKMLDGLAKYKYPLIVLIVGLVLLLIPSGSTKSSSDGVSNDDEQRLAAILESSRGVGNASVLISEHGALVVCDGAADPEVKLSVIKSVEAYTGLGCDEIQVLITRQN